MKVLFTVREFHVSRVKEMLLLLVFATGFWLPRAYISPKHLKKQARRSIVTLTAPTRPSTLASKSSQEVPRSSMELTPLPAEPSQYSARVAPGLLSAESSGWRLQILPIGSKVVPFWDYLIGSYI